MTFTSIPAKVVSCHLVEFQVEWSVEVPQSLHHLRVNVGMGPAFGFSQAVGFTAALCLLEAWETLGLVEIKVFVCDDPLESQEVLDAAQLPCWVADETLATHKQYLAHGEVLQPVVQVLGVDADLDGAPRGVDEPRSPVFEGEALKRRNVRLLGQCLCVV